ncbi:MAG: class I SAM-dependent methyltransferase [Bacteroidota bacterium]
MINPYQKYILPKVVHWACDQRSSKIQRSKIIPLAKGKVLEIGIGSGLNLPFYDQKKIQSLTAIDPSSEIWNLNQYNINQLDFDFKFVQAFAEEIPFQSNSFDNIVITYSLCTIKDIITAMNEMKRVLKPKGQLLFCEHGIAPDKSVINIQNTINPVWKRVGGGCNLNRDIPQLIMDNGFKIIDLQKMYIPGWKFASFNYWGVAEVE